MIDNSFELMIVLLKHLPDFQFDFNFFSRNVFNMLSYSKNLGLELKNDPDIDMSAKLHQLCKIFCNNQFAIIFADLYMCICIICYEANRVLC